MSVPPLDVADSPPPSSPEVPKEGDSNTEELDDNPESPEEEEQDDEETTSRFDDLLDDPSPPPFDEIPDLLETDDLVRELADIEEENEKDRWDDDDDDDDDEDDDEDDEDEASLASFVWDNDQVAGQNWDDLETYDPFMSWEDCETQTDWDWADKNLYLNYKNAVQKETVDLEEEADINIDFPEPPTETEGFPVDIEKPFIGLPRIIAYRPEARGPLSMEESLSSIHLVECEYCKQLCHPITLKDFFVLDDDNAKHFCCEEAKQMQEFIHGERRKLEQTDAIRRVIDENPPIPKYDLKSKSEKDRMRQMLGHLDDALSGVSVGHLLRDSTSTDHATSQATLKSTDDEIIPGEVVVRYYKNDNYFLIMCPDGSGSLLYPSGRPAIVISSSRRGEITHIILEDKDHDCQMRGIFTNTGYATCYYPNRSIWFSATPDGGFCFNESGGLTRRWNWLYFDPHMRNLPFKPLTFTLGPFISVRIHGQEQMYVTFRHSENTARFNVGSKIKRICPESHLKQNLEIMERYVNLKYNEVLAILDQMETCIAHPSILLHKIKPHHRFIARKQRLSERLEMERALANEDIFAD